MDEGETSSVTIEDASSEVRTGTGFPGKRAEERQNSVEGPFLGSIPAEQARAFLEENAERHF